MPFALQAVIPTTMPVFVIGMIPYDGRQSARLMLFHRSYQASDMRQLPLHVVRAVNGSTVAPYSVLNVKSLAELEQGEAIGYRTNHGEPAGSCQGSRAVYPMACRWSVAAYGVLDGSLAAPCDPVLTMVRLPGAAQTDGTAISVPPVKEPFTWCR